MAFFKSLFGKKKGTSAAAHESDGSVVKLPGGDTYKGEWKDGRMHGVGEYNFATGEKYIGEFSNGQLSGQGRFYYRNGTVYEGRFANGRRNGSGTMTYPDGSRYEGNWIADKKSGYGKCYYADGRTYRGMFLDGDMTDGFMTVKNEQGVWENMRYGTMINNSGAPSVKLVSYPENRKIQIIKEVREFTCCGIAHAKDIAENVPQLLKVGVTSEEIADCMARFESLGAVIEVIGEAEAVSLPSLILRSYPEDRLIHVIKEIREFTGCGVAHAKEIAENVPQLLKAVATPEEIADCMARFEPLGAVIEVSGGTECAAPTMTLTLLSFPADRRLGIVRVIKDTMHCSHDEAKGVSENLPQRILTDLNEMEIAKVKKEFERYGAAVEIKCEHIDNSSM